MQSGGAEGHRSAVPGTRRRGRGWERAGGGEQAAAAAGGLEAALGAGSPTPAQAQPPLACRLRCAPLTRHSLPPLSTPHPTGGVVGLHRKRPASRAVAPATCPSLGGVLSRLPAGCCAAPLRSGHPLHSSAGRSVLRGPAERGHPPFRRAGQGRARRRAAPTRVAGATSVDMRVVREPPGAGVPGQTRDGGHATDNATDREVCLAPRL